MPTSDLWPIAIKDAPRSNYKFVSYLLKVADGLNNHAATFTNADPPAADIEKAADDLSAANAKAKHGTPADTADRDAKRQAADLLVDRLVVHVQTTLHATPTSAADAAAKILTVGLGIQKQRTDTKPAFAAKHGFAPNEIAFMGHPFVICY
jgi:hypothetical protein